MSAAQKPSLRGGGLMRLKGLVRKEFLQIVRDLHAFVVEADDDAPAELQHLAKRAGSLIRSLAEIPAAPEGATIATTEDAPTSKAG